MTRYFCGIDNGSTGSIAIITDTGFAVYKEMPVKHEQSYTKKRQEISRVDVPALRLFLLTNLEVPSSFVLLERPMVNPGRFKATASALRCLEATLIVLEELGLAYAYCDSKEWQRVLLPQGTSKEDLKPVSLDIARRLYPTLKPKKDGDSILIAEYLKRKS